MKQDEAHLGGAVSFVTVLVGRGKKRTSTTARCAQRCRRWWRSGGGKAVPVTLAGGK